MWIQVFSFIFEREKHSEKHIWLFFFFIEAGTSDIFMLPVKDQSVGDTQLLLPLTLNQGDVMWVKKQTGAAALDNKPKWQVNRARPPRH